MLVWQRPSSTPEGGVCRRRSVYLLRYVIPYPKVLQRSLPDRGNLGKVIIRMCMISSGSAVSEIDTKF